MHKQLHDLNFVVYTSFWQLISKNELVIGIRDTESVVEFQKRISSARRMIVVGNGGIASELMYVLPSNKSVLFSIF